MVRHAVAGVIFDSSYPSNSVLAALLAGRQTTLWGAEMGVPIAVC